MRFVASRIFPGPFNRKSVRMTMEIRVDVSLRWADMDVNGHVNNVVFFRLLEEARARFFLAPGSASQILERGIVVASQRLDYLRPLVYRPDPIGVGLTVTAIGRSSFTLDCRVINSTSDPEECVYATGSVVMVAFDAREGRSRALETEEIAWLEEPLGAN